MPEGDLRVRLVPWSSVEDRGGGGDRTRRQERHGWERIFGILNFTPESAGGIDFTISPPIVQTQRT